jgi:leucine dehydrogenase
MPFGGSKITVQCTPVDLDDLSSVGFLAYCLDRSRSVTGPDMGFSPSLSDVMHEQGLSHNITGGLKNRLGPTGTPTAYGIFVALKEALAFRYGSDSLAGRTVVVQGLGAVGRPLVEEHLVHEDVVVYCSDVNPEAVDRLVRRHPGKVRALAPAEVLTWEADIFLPCAVGGILDEEAIRGLRYSVVMGAANNQLRATTHEEEVRLARLLADRGILFQTDWIQNAGGVIAGMEEYLRGEEASMESVRAQVERACGLGTRENLAAAQKEGVTPTEMAYRRYSERIYR